MTISLNDTLGRRLRFALERLNMAEGFSNRYNPNWLSRQIGVTRAAVYKWMNNPNAGIDGENLANAARSLRVSPDWLATGHGEPAITLSTSTYVCANSRAQAVQQIKEKGLEEVLKVIQELTTSPESYLTAGQG